MTFTEWYKHAIAGRPFGLNMATKLAWEHQQVEIDRLRREIDRLALDLKMEEK